VHRQTVARHALKNYSPNDVPTDHIPTRAAAAREKFAGMLEFLEADSA
jgi:acyl-CoA dehydrogenase